MSETFRWEGRRDDGEDTSLRVHYRRLLDLELSEMRREESVLPAILLVAIVDYTEAKEDEKFSHLSF